MITVTTTKTTADSGIQVWIFLTLLSERSAERSESKISTDQRAQIMITVI